MQVDWETDSAAVTTRTAKDIDAQMGKRTVTTGCGQGTVFGDLMDEIDKHRAPQTTCSLTDAKLFVLLEKVRKHETIYKQAGAVHGCALATDRQARS